MACLHQETDRSGPTFQIHMLSAEMISLMHLQMTCRMVLDPVNKMKLFSFTMLEYSLMALI